MAFTYIGNASANGTGVTSLSCNRPVGTQVGHLLVAVYAFEGVAAGSGPWIIPNIGQYSGSTIGPASGWQQACWQTPAAAGVGIEVWWAINGGVSAFIAQFAAAQNVQAVTAEYSGEYNPTGTVNPSTVRVASTAQVTGNQPPAPSVSANTGELVIAVGGDLMGGSGFGTPSGFTNRVDANRGGAGTVEATIADAPIVAAGPTGPITFPNAAAATTTRGATATLAIVPAPSGASVGPILDIPMPADLDLADGWKLRVTALDPVTGAPVSGVTVANLALEVALGPDTSAGDLAVGPYLLVPGSGA